MYKNMALYFFTRALTKGASPFMSAFWAIGRCSRLQVCLDPTHRGVFSILSCVSMYACERDYAPLYYSVSSFTPVCSMSHWSCNACPMLGYGNP